MPYQLSIVGRVTSGGELGFDFREGDLEMTSTTKEHSRHAISKIQTWGSSDNK